MSESGVERAAGEAPTPAPPPTVWLDADADWPAVPTHLLVGGVLLLLFFFRLGSYGLWDPWEGHYAEVAREILTRRDAIRLHWEKEWFWSKPVLSFWLMAMSFRLFGIGRGGPSELTDSFRPEWAARLPFALCAALGLLALYLAFTRRLGRRASALGTIAAASCAQVLFISRQAITDMLFVGLCCMALAAYLCSLDAADDDPPPQLTLGGLLGEGRTLPLQVLAFGLIALCVVPQLWLIGTSLYRPSPPYNRPDPLGLGGWPTVLPFAVVTAAIGVYALRLCRGARESWLLLAYLAAGVAVLAKGIPGLVLPLAVLGVYGLLSGELKRELRSQVLAAHAVGLAVVACVALPWFVAMSISFPGSFFNEFFGQHHWKRLAVGVHGDTGGLDYYVPWLAYGLFPWSGLAAVGLITPRVEEARAVEPSPERESARARLLLCAWVVVAFAIFTFTKTKFHHYVLPATLPMAFLAGVTLDQTIRGRVNAGLLALALIIFAATAQDLYTNGARLIWLFVYNYKRPWPPELNYQRPIFVLSVLYALPFSALIATRALGFSARARSAAVLGLLAAALGASLFLAQKYQPETARHWTQKELIARYYAERDPERPEPLVAWQMNWRGETFYTKGAVLPFVALNNAGIKQWLARQREGKRIFLIFEKTRLDNLKKLLGSGPASRLEVLTGRENNKFYLARTTLGQARPAPAPASEPDPQSGGEPPP